MFESVSRFVDGPSLDFRLGSTLSLKLQCTGKFHVGPMLGAESRFESYQYIIPMYIVGLLILAVCQKYLNNTSVDFGQQLCLVSHGFNRSFLWHTIRTLSEKPRH